MSRCKAHTWMDLRVLCWMKLGKEKYVCSHFCAESENADLIEIESKTVANRGLRVGREMSRCWSGYEFLAKKKIVLGDLMCKICLPRWS